MLGISFICKMKSLFILAAVFALAQGETEETESLYVPHQGLPPADAPTLRANFATWRTIVQKLDHFDASNSRTWKMRYIDNDVFFKAGGPIFIMLGAEWTIDTSWVESGQMFEMARIHGASMYYTEHRYYGESHPTKDLSTSNLKYLTTAQALADVANLITTLKKRPQFAKSKVVVFGGSYGGTMAIWMREKYPKLVHSALSSSAPLLAKVDFKEYNDVIKRDLGPKCAGVITRGVDEILRLISVGNVAKLQKDFNLCRALDTNNANDKAYFFSSISGRINNLIQYANSKTIPDLCKKLENPTTKSDYDRLAAYIKKDKYCMGGYKNLIRSMTNTSLSHGDSRQWTYQTCTEYGFFQTSWASSALYGRTMSVDYFQRWCLDFFGPGFTAAVTAKGVAATNAKYGALNPQVTRVVSVQGTVDPWSALGLSKTVNPLTPVIVVKGTSHCADLKGLSSRDPPEMYQAKLSVRNYIAAWLKQP